MLKQMLAFPFLAIGMCLMLAGVMIRFGVAESYTWLELQELAINQLERKGE